MNRVNIDLLTEPELIDLNRRIVERLRLIQQMRAHKTMLEFRLGDWVEFDADGPTPVVGTLTRYNKKSVTVLAEDGRRWNVSPGLLRLADSSQGAARAPEVQKTSVIPFKK